jgi:hypothetical protein
MSFGRPVQKGYSSTNAMIKPPGTKKTWDTPTDDVNIYDHYVWETQEKFEDTKGVISRRK